MKNIAEIKNFENLTFKKKGNVYMTFPKLGENEKKIF